MMVVVWIVILGGAGALATAYLLDALVDWQIARKQARDQEWAEQHRDAKG